MAMSEDDRQKKRREARLRWYYKNREHANDKHQEWLLKHKVEQVEYNRSYYAGHVEAKRLYARTYYATNTYKANASNRITYAKNKTRYRPTRAKWKGKNREKLRADSKKWRADNPHKASEYCARRRARELGNGGDHTTAEWLTVLRLHGNRCHWCGVKGNSRRSLTKDHYIALSEGGSNDAKNLVPACIECNRRKHKRDPLEFAQSIGFLL